MTYLYVAIGSAMGGIARYGCGVWISGWANTALPWGTIVVNVLGSGLIGVLLGLSERADSWFATADARNFLMVGVLGGFTTFSAFSLQTLELLRAQQWSAAGANVLLSVALCLAAVAIGYWLAASAA
jgi:CrcB protein